MAITRIKSLPYEIDVRICGFPREVLVPVDIDLSIIGEPQWIVYESIERMFKLIDDYDCFLNIEDDVFVNGDLVANALAFNAASEVNEVYLPNRMERRADGAMACVDLEAIPGWTGMRRTFKGTMLGVPVNPHSGLLFLSRQQMRYAADFARSPGAIPRGIHGLGLRQPAFAISGLASQVESDGPLRGACGQLDGQQSARCASSFRRRVTMDLPNPHRRSQSGPYSTTKTVPRP